MPTAHEKKPRISVVIATQNRPRRLMRAIRSVLDQRNADFELIVVDDGSDVDPAAIFDTITEERLRFLPQKRNGRSAARNAGARQARGPVLTFLDDDDQALSGWLEALRRPFEDPTTGIVCCGEKIVFERQRSRQPREIFPSRLGPVFYQQTGRFRTGTFAVRRDLFTDIGGYSEQLSFAENTDLSLRLIRECLQRDLRVVNIPRALVQVHMARVTDRQQHFHERLESAKFMLDHHGSRFRTLHPGGFANYCAIAGVNAARLGLHAESRHFFLKAVRIQPGRWRHSLRLALSLAPALARAFWLRASVDNADCLG